MKKNFGTWAREMAPSMSPDEMSRKAHLAVLKDRLRTMEQSRQRRHARMRKASMVAVFVCFTFLGGYVSELGSDQYVVMENGEFVGLEGLVHQSVTIGHVGHQITGDSLDVDKAMDWVDQKEAGFGKPTRCEMIEINGRQFWLTFSEFNLMGDVEERHNQIQDRPWVLTGEISAFMGEYYRDWVLDIKAGKIEEDRTFFEVVDGLRYLCREFHKEFPGYGMVKLYRGVYAPED